MHTLYTRGMEDDTGVILLHYINGDVYLSIYNVFDLFFNLKYNNVQKYMLAVNIKEKAYLLKIREDEHIEMYKPEDVEFIMHTCGFSSPIFKNFIAQFEKDPDIS